VISSERALGSRLRHLRIQAICLDGSAAAIASDSILSSFATFEARPDSVIAAA
jgi:hypothetical protein